MASTSAETSAAGERRSPTLVPALLEGSSKVQWTPPKRANAGSLKGKEKALMDNTYPGEVTYRALLGNMSGPLNPLRCIAHIDIDCAYASMEMVRLGLDPSIPLAVQQWQGLIAVNYAARKYGITRMENATEARKKCPHIKLVHCAVYRQGETEPRYLEEGEPPAMPATHKISLDYYRRESLKIISIFSSFCPIVEKASIDESFLDVSLPVREVLLSRYPFLATVPLGCTLDTPLPTPFSMGVKLPWELAGNVIPLSRDADDDQEGEPLDELDEAISWSDVALFCAAEIVAACRKAVQNQLGYTCSAGIAPNKTLAKLCSGYKKPNDQTVLRFASIAGFLRPMKFKKIRNLGGKLGKVIKETYEAESVGDLLKVSLGELQNKLGEDSGMWVWEIIRGIDFVEVETKTNVKSMISSKNFRPSISRYKEALHWIHILAVELHLRLCEARDNSPSLWPKTITLTHRSDAYVIRSHQIPFPFTSRLDIPYVDKQANKLLRAAIGERATYEDSTPIGPWTNLQLTLSGLERLEKGQEGIERFFSGAVPTSTELVKRESLKRELEAGSRAGSAEEPKPKKKKLVEVKMRAVSVVKDEDEKPAKVKGKKKQTSGVLDLTIDSDDTPSARTFKCPQCQKSLPVPSADDEALQRVKAEHEDYHFARTMLEKEREAERAPSRSLAEPRAKLSTDAKAVVTVKKKGEVNPKGGQQSLVGFFAKR